LANQIGPNQDIISGITGERPVTNRAPGLTQGQAILNACAAHGLYETHTDMNTTDWMSPRRSASYLIQEFASVLHPGGILLYHDGGNRRPTPDALEGMIQIGISRGYRFATATDLVNSGTPQPGSMAYRTTSSETRSIEETTSSSDSDLVTCNYNARATLMQRLEDPYVKLAERSRIVEILAEYDDLEKAS
jgi:hypothetical protein